MRPYVSRRFDPSFSARTRSVCRDFGVHCAADGELVREEIAMIEAMMGRAMIHPELGSPYVEDLNNPSHLSNFVDLDSTLLNSSSGTPLVAAVDGDYDRH